ncbi:MAG: FtsX-like permease family protein [Enterococcus italicus]
MLTKILLRSFSKQLRAYMVYFLCILTAVMIFYSFGAMTYDQPIVRSVKQDVQLDGVLSFGNIVVAMVVLSFMLSANHFFFQQRKNELGIYQLFGMKKVQIVTMFLLETILLNVFSLVTGMLMGLLFSKLFTMILIEAMGLNIASVFFISWASVRNTILVFLFALFVTSMQNIWLLRGKTLTPLLQAEKEGFYSSKYWGFSRRMMACLGVIFISIGYYVSIHFLAILEGYIKETEDFSAIFWLPILIFALCIAGTFLFYAYTLPQVFDLIARRKGMKYRSLYGFMLGSIRFQVHKSWRILSFVTVIVGFAILFIGTASGLFALSYRLNAMENPTMFQVTPQKEAKLTQLIADEDGVISAEEKVTFKLTGVYLKQKLAAIDKKFVGQADLVNLVSLSEYQQVQRLFPDAPRIDQLSDQETVFFNQDFLISRKLSTYDRTVQLFQGETLTMTAMYGDYFGNNMLRYSENLLVVTDAVCQRITGYTHQLIYLNASGLNQATFQTAYEKQLKEEWIEPLYYAIDYKNQALTGTIQSEKLTTTNDNTYNHYSGEALRLSSTNRYPRMRLARREGGLFIFVSVFVGGIILVSTASSLIVRQFSRAEEEQANFRLLKNLGVSEKERRRAIYFSNAGIFFPVILLATTHGSVAVYTVVQLLPGASYWVVYLFGLLAIVSFSLFYVLSAVISIRITEQSS